MMVEVVVKLAVRGKVVVSVLLVVVLLVGVVVHLSRH